MKDWQGTDVKVNDKIIYVTLKGHKPVMHEAIVHVAESARVRVEVISQSFDNYAEVPRSVWLHSPENLIVISKSFSEV
jgi:hypothetical protein